MSFSLAPTSPIYFFTTSRNLLFGLPLFLFFTNTISITLLPTYSRSLLMTCPYHLSLPFFIFIPNRSTLTVPLMYSFVLLLTMCFLKLLQLRSIPNESDRMSIGSFLRYNGLLLTLNVTGSQSNTVLETSLPKRQSYVTDFQSLTQNEVTGRFVIEIAASILLNRKHFESEFDYRYNLTHRF